MVRKTTGTPSYEPEAIYLVKVKRAVPLGAVVLRPRDEEIRIKGKMVDQLGDAIASAVKVG